MMSLDLKMKNNKKTCKTISKKSIFSVTTSLGTVNLFLLFIPMLISSITNNLIGTINTAVLSGYSEEAVAATGTTNTLISLFDMLFLVVSTGASVTISNYIGGERLKKASNTCYVSIVICGFLGLLCSIIFLGCSYQVISFMNLKGQVLDQAVIYFRIRIVLLIIPAISSALSAIIQCYGYPKYTVFAGISSILCNLILNIIVVYFPQYSPIKGVAGIAVGSVISQLLSLVIVLYFFKKIKIKVLRTNEIKDFLKYVYKILRIGIPSGISSSSFTLSQVITASFIANLGVDALSAKVYFTNILCYAYLFSMNIGNANAILIGRLIGAGNYEQAKQLNRSLVKITMSVNSAISILIILLREPLLSLFTDNNQIIKMSLAVFLIDFLIEQARAVSHVYEYSLRAAGDTFFTMIVVVISCWCCSVGLAYFFSIKCGMGLIGCWLGLLIDESIRAIATYIRWHLNKWLISIQNQKK